MSRGADAGGASQGGTPTRTLDRGLQVLEAVAARPGGGLADLARDTGLSPATALRILNTLAARGYIAREGAGPVYRIGLRAFEIGMQFRAELRLQESCGLLLQTLADATGQTALLAVRDGAVAVIIDFREGNSVLRTTPRIGARLPLHATAAGKVLLAWEWEARQRDLLGPEPFAAFTEVTRQSLADLRREYAAIRETGLAQEDCEHAADVAAFAAPVRALAGDVVAALALQAPAAGAAAQADVWRAQLSETAIEASRRLGWREGIGLHAGKTESAIPDD